MSDELKTSCGDPECECGCKDGDECHCDDIEVVELEDESGEMEEFAILDELDFEGRHFVIMAPLVEVQAFHEAENGEDGAEELNLSIDIYECENDNFNLVEDEDLARRVMEHLEKLSHELEANN